VPIENFDQAVEALTNAQNGIESVDTTPTEPVNQPNESGVQATDALATPVVETPQIDLNSLDPTVRSYVETREREMQADYTRKTQEVAAQRKEAEQALEFINALNTDPSFALQVHETLSQALQQQGYSVEQANAAANQQMQGNADDLFVDPYMEKIQELENWKTAQEQRIREAEASARIESSIAAIRSDNPNYKDDDIKDILTMAFAYGGDVLQAANAYKTVTQRIVEGYVGQKESVPASLNQPSSTGHAEIPPEGFKSLNDPRLEEAARKMLAESGAQF
jgi:hypothetical protein